MRRNSPGALCASPSRAMRHKYVTEVIVLGRTTHGEANALVTLLTKELGLIRARAQGVRKPGAKLAHALTTLAGSDVTLIRGKEGWRLAGAILSYDYFESLEAPARERVGRIAALIARLVSGESTDATLYTLMDAFLRALPMLSDEEGENAEVLAALLLLSSLGLDAGEMPPGELFAKDALAYVGEHRTALVSRVNRGIQASGL